MPTISGLRRRGYTPEAIRNFCELVGVARRENVIDVGLLEHCVREDLNRNAARAMVVTDPIKLVITNYPEGKTETLTSEINPRIRTPGCASCPSVVSSTSNATISWKCRRRSISDSVRV